MKINLLTALSAGNNVVIKLILALGLFLTASPGKTQTGQALDFDGVDDYISLPTSLVISGNYTKEVWINPSALTGFPNILSGTGTALFINNGFLAAGHAGSFNQLLDPTSSLSVGTWYHVAVTYNATSGEMNLYKNAVLVQGPIIAPTYNETQLEIARFLGANHFTGLMDELRIWNTVRTAEEISNNKNCELTGDEPGLLAYYNFNQGVAGGTNTGITSLIDNYDNCVISNGTLTNFTLSGSTSNWITPGATISGGCTNYFANINVTGNGSCIINGDTNPSSIDFTSFGSSLFTPITRNFTIHNTGNSSLTIAGISIAGVNAANFSVTSSPVSSVAAGSSTTMTISFNPIGSQGIKNATISINNNDTDESSYSFVVDGFTIEQGKSLNFDGVDDKVDLPFLFSGSYTKEAWIKTSYLGGFPNIISGNSSTGTALFLNSGRLAAGHGPSFNQALDPVALSPDTWYHIAVTYDSITQTMQLYKNGYPVFLVPIAAVPNYTETSQSIGSLSATNYFPGQIDQVRFWSKARTDGEILSSYNCTLSGDEPGLTAWYNFTNGLSEGNNSGLTTLEDFSDHCNPNNGSLVGFALSGNFSNWIADSVTLSGTCSATYPNIKLSGNSICIIDKDNSPSLADNTDFGDQSATGADKIFTITNTGNATLNIGSISFTGTDNSMFIVTSAPAASLAAGASTSVTVHFTPVGLGIKTAAILINNDDPDEAAFSFSLKGTGVAAPLVISNIVTTPNANGNSTITWTTDIPSTSVVDYGTISNNLNQNTNNASLVTSHSIQISGLTMGTTYYFRVSSADAGNNLVTEPTVVNAPLSFSMPPAISLQPLSQSVCEKSEVSFNTAATSDITATVQWQFSTDNGINWLDSIGATNTSITFNVSRSDNGKKIRAIWTNTGGNSISDTVTLTVKDTSFSITNVAVCSNLLPYSWNGNNYNAS
ncbi:MAG: LamG-like jellyroll fold domain-containing protein, partial [Ferruginibacter sp.]